MLVACWSEAVYDVVAESGRGFVTSPSGARISGISLSDTLPAVTACDEAPGVATAQLCEAGAITDGDFIHAIHQAAIDQR
jgi:hypothetical protein